jgi:hypothetical protein
MSRFGGKATSPAPVSIRSHRARFKGERGVQTRSQVTSRVQERWVSFEDVSELDEPRLLAAPIAADICAVDASVHVDAFVLFIAAGSVPVRLGGQPSRPGRVAAVAGEIAADVVCG